MGVYDPSAPPLGYVVPSKSGPPHPATSGEYTWNSVRNGDQHTVRDAQAFLNHKGFNIGIDGIWGPQTASALRHYLHGGKPTRANNSSPAPNASNAPAHPNTRAPKGGGGGGGGGMPPAPPMPSVGGPFNPKKLALSMVNTEYGPAIAQLKGLLGDVANQDQFNQGQIGGYYKQMLNLIRQQDQGQGDFTAGAEKQVTDAIGNDAQLFGGANAPTLAPAASNAAGYLGAVGASQQDYLANMLPLLKAQEASGTANEQHTAAAQQASYENQLQSQYHARGNAYTQAYQQAIQDQASQEQNQLALQEAQAMLPYKEQSAKYGAQAAKYNARSAQVGAQYAGVNAALGVQSKQAAIKHYQALTNSEMASAKRDIVKAQASGATNVLAPGSTTYDRIVGNLTRSLYTGGGKNKAPLVNPLRAKASLFQGARAQGLIDANGRELVPGSVNMLNAVLRGMYQRDAAWQKNYTWKNGTFVARG